MPKIKVSDVNLYYEIYGSGEPIVFISGFTADHSKWLKVVNSFAKKHQVIIFDNRGAGQSDCPEYPYTIDMMTGDVVGLCEKLNIDLAHFVGNSMGGAIAQALAYKYPQFVKSVVISNSAIKFNVKVRLLSEANLALRKSNIDPETFFKRTICDIFSVNFLSREHVVDFLLKQFVNYPYPITYQGYCSQMHALLEFDSHAWIKKITTPSLVIYSDEDALVDIESSEALIKAIPNSESYCFSKVGHCPDIEQPDVFVKVVEDFIKKFN